MKCALCKEEITNQNSYSGVPLVWGLVCSNCNKVVMREVAYDEIMTEILHKIFIDKIFDFLKCCIENRNAKLINEVLDILNENIK